jgi:hypothetical protein
MSLSLILLIAAAIFAFLAMISLPSPPRLQWLGAALFFYFLSLVLAGAHALVLR